VLQSTPAGDVQHTHDGAPQWFPRSDAPEVEAQREVEAALQPLMKQSEQAAAEQDADLVKDGLQEEPPETCQPETGVDAESPLGVAFEFQQQQQQQHEQQQEQKEQQQEPQQEHLSAEKKKVDLSPAKPAQQGTCGGCHLELFTTKPKQIQRLQLQPKRTDNDAVRNEDGHTVSQLHVSKNTNWWGLPRTTGQGAVKHGRTQRAAWEATAVATAAAAAAAFVLAEAKEGKTKQGSHEEHKQTVSLAESEAGIGSGALKVWARNCSWLPSANISIQVPLNSAPPPHSKYWCNRRRRQQPPSATPVKDQLDSSRSSTVAAAQGNVNLRFEYI